MLDSQMPTKENAENESTEDKIRRLEAMASGDDSWDLSTNDMNAIQWALNKIRLKDINLSQNIVGLQSAIAWIKEHPQEGVLDTAIDEINAVINRMQTEKE
jgi:hypothetical protein